MLQASEGLVVIIILIFIFGIISRPPRSKQRRAKREPEIAWEVPIGQTTNNAHDAAYSAASRTAQDDRYSPDQKIITGAGLAGKPKVK